MINEAIIKKEGKSMANESISKQKNDGIQPSDSYTIRADKDPFGANVYFGYKDNRQYTDAEDTIYDLLEHNPEYANTQVIENSLMKGFISDEDYADAALIVMTAEEKAAHIEAVEMAMDWNDAYEEPGVSKADYLLYEKLIDERAEMDKSQYENYSIFHVKISDHDFYYSDKNTDLTALLKRYADCGNVIPKMLTEECNHLDEYTYALTLQRNPNELVFAAEIDVETNTLRVFKSNSDTYYSENLDSAIKAANNVTDIPENDISLLKKASYWEKPNGICAVAEYKSGNRVPYFYENFESSLGLERAVSNLDADRGIDSYALYSDGKPVPLSEINAVREKNYSVGSRRSKSFEWIPGMEISEQLYDEMYNVLPPLHLKNVCGFQSSEPYSCAENPSTGAFEPMFMTFVNIGDKYFYAGTNFAHEVNQAQYDNIINSINAGQAQTKTPANVNKTNPFDAFSSPLDAFRENARQFNLARIAAKEAKASILEYTDIEGRTHKRYWNGAAFTDRASSLYEREHSGVFKAQFELPGNTTPNTGQTKPPVICKPKGRR